MEKALVIVIGSGDLHLNLRLARGIRAVMDGISSAILVAGLGPGVFFATLVVLVYQGGISLAAQLLTGPGTALPSSPPLLAELDAAGGAILIALALKPLKLRDLKPGDLLPALSFAPVLALLFRALGGWLIVCPTCTLSSPA